MKRIQVKLASLTGQSGVTVSCVGRTKNTEELLLQIALSPEDDDLKKVCADALLAEGKPWGELITLQLAEVRSPRAVKREQELLGVAWHWLPDAMKRVVSPRGLRFEKGFLSFCRIIGSTEDCAAAAMHPLWATVKAMHGGTMTLAQGCPTLKRWTGLTPTRLLTGLGDLPKLEVLGVSWNYSNDDEGVASVISKAVRLGLRELHVSSGEDYGYWPYYPDEDETPNEGPIDAGDIAGWARLGMIPSVLRIYNGFTDLVRLRRRLQEEGIELGTLGIRSYFNSQAQLHTDWDLELRSVKAGDFRAAKLSHASLDFDCEGDPPLDLEAMLELLPNKFFESVTLVGSGWAKVRRLPCFDGATITREDPPKTPIPAPTEARTPP